MGKPLPNVNSNIRAEMARAGLSQEDVARLLGVSQSAVSRRLTGSAEWSVSELIEVAGHLGCPLSDLLRGHVAA